MVPRSWAVAYLGGEGGRVGPSKAKAKNAQVFSSIGSKGNTVNQKSRTFRRVGRKVD